MALGKARIWRGRDWSVVLPLSALVSVFTALMGWLDLWRLPISLVLATFLWFLSGYLVRAQFGSKESATAHAAWPHRLLGLLATTLVIASPLLAAEWRLGLLFTAVLSAVVSFLWGFVHRAFVTPASRGLVLRALILVDD